jgi:RNA polymerase sigma-70 factor (ECF subfamily)
MSALDRPALVKVRCAAMPGREEAGSAFRPIVYCVIPRDLAPRLHDCLRRHFANDPSVEVVVEQRMLERRGTTQRRAGKGNTAPAPERRRIGGVAGRRVGPRRAITTEAQPLPLPRRVRPHAERIFFFERLEPSRQQAEDTDTARLVMRFQQGERDSFAVLYARHFDRVFAYLRTVLRDSHEAEDATQQVFIRVLGALDRYQPGPQPFRAWLFVIARNHALNVLRRNGRLDVLEPAEVDRRRDEHVDDELPLSALEWISDRELVMFTERLPLEQRQVLLLRFMLDLPHSQVASVLGRTPVEVRDLQRRALSFLRARLTAVGRDVRPDRGARMIRRRGHAYVLRKRRFSLTHPN